ncbi:MAG TPA: hypothetical protein VHE61_13385 [Opitutaceae bacterium]|nr:hypothetical protein [Opitutaceae bacterium]
MATDAAEFGEIVTVVLRRFFAQNGRPPPEPAALAGFAANLWKVVRGHGLPRPLGPGESGRPGEMTDEECTPLVAGVVGNATDPLLVTAARQLVKACLYPEFRNCRNSFREVAADGTCRRQEPGRLLGRVSGSHCVDCPHWIALTPEQHERFLAHHWRAGAADFAAHRDVALPEDFRALRHWVHAASRRES